MLDPSVLQIADLPGFIADPRDKLVVVGGWAYWQLGVELAGCVAFGPITHADVDGMLPAYKAILGRAPRPLPFLGDVRRLSPTDTDPSVLWSIYLGNQEAKPLVERGMARLAVLLPSSPMAALIAGLLALNRPTRVDLRVMRGQDELTRWVGDLIALPALEARLAELVPGLDTASGLLHDVRTLLAREPGLRLDDVVRRLAVSERSLQRELARGGTSFRREHLRARMSQGLSAIGAGARRLAALAAGSTPDVDEG